VTSENSPSKVAAVDQPFIQRTSADAVVSAESDASAAPFTTNDAPGMEDSPLPAHGVTELKALVS
jgi:hypothetical protein